MALADKRVRRTRIAWASPAVGRDSMALRAPLREHVLAERHAKRVPAVRAPIAHALGRATTETQTRTAMSVRACHVPGA